MVVDVDKLSDAELRTKLLEFGFPVMPITGTTRKVMAKKLKMLLENKNKIGNEGGRRSLGRYSSEDESDNDVKVTKKKENRRVTMAAPLMQPPAPSMKVKKNSRFNEQPELEVPDSPIRKEIRTTTTNRSHKIVRSTQDEFDTGSDSEPDLNYQSKGSDRLNSSLISSVNSSIKYSPPKSVETSYSTRNISFNTNVSPSRLTSYNSPSLASEYATDKLNQIRSRLSLNNPSYEKTSYSLTSDREETPFLSNFTKRLSNLSSQKNDYDYKNDIIKEHDINGSSGTASIRSQLNRSTRGRETTYDYRANRNNILKNNFVSFAVLAGAALFFVLLAIMYMGMRSDTSVIPSDYNVPHCVNDDPKSKKMVNCVSENDVYTAIHLLNVIKPELTKRAVAHTCFDPKIKPQMTDYEIISFCLTNYAIKDHEQIKNDLRNLFILTFKNPQWNLHVAQTEDNTGVVNEKDFSKNMEQVIFNQDKKTTSLIMLNPPLPWKCVFYNSFSFILNSVIFIVLIFGSLYLSSLGYKYYKYHNQKQIDEIGFMVERIIDILQSNASEDLNGENFVVINHVRDMILPVGERQNKSSTWAKAVKFINEHESRVRTEVREVKGEPFEVWRWIGNPNISNSRNDSSFGYRQGRRIVDPEYLINETLKFSHGFLRFCKNSDVIIKNEVREGFVSVFVLECRKCKVQHSICSEEPESDLLSANLAFIAGIVSLGLNLFELNELCSSLHIPLISAESYKHYLKEIFDIYNETDQSTYDKLKHGDTSFEKVHLISSTPKLKYPDDSDTDIISSSTPDQTDISFYEIKKNKFLEELKKTPKEIEEISKLTVNQKDNPVWFQERRKRLTASNFGRICKLLDTF
ncbi:uncharacterized protein LOC130440859 isoform X2 [Diorhabda sublineata]|uniref:uncharacterized protein LOC130440859 isoform X2 n=1 Tax=Diorhabda sublineata TaxID=1163346 RepID=UPI0024E12CA9|nr:uncharacterized protein LOC130440859 isoform X2 [Diorhabda sublineata]